MPKIRIEVVADFLNAGDMAKFELLEDTFKGVNSFYDVHLSSTNITSRTFEIRFNGADEANAMWGNLKSFAKSPNTLPVGFQTVANEFSDVSAITISMNKHLCCHDYNPEQWTPCSTQQAQYESVVV